MQFRHHERIYSQSRSSIKPWIMAASFASRAIVERKPLAVRTGYWDDFFQHVVLVDQIIPRDHVKRQRMLLYVVLTLASFMCCSCLLFLW